MRYAARPMQTLPLRLRPGDDLKHALVAAAAGHDAAFVVAGIGSLSRAALRFAGVEHLQHLEGDLELLTLSGSLARNGVHLHATVADARGQVRGGHVGPGCIVRTTAEILLVSLQPWQFSREHDAATGFNELVVRSGPAP